MANLICKICNFPVDMGEYEHIICDYCGDIVHGECVGNDDKKCKLCCGEMEGE